MTRTRSKNDVPFTSPESKFLIKIIIISDLEIRIKKFLRHLGFFKLNKKNLSDNLRTIECKLFKSYYYSIISNRNYKL